MANDPDPICLHYTNQLRFENINSCNLSHDGNILESQLCTTTRDGFDMNDVCGGDSGGPITSRLNGDNEQTLLGIVSYGDECEGEEQCMEGDDDCDGECEDEEDCDDDCEEGEDCEDECEEGEDCNEEDEGDPGVHTNVSYFLDWICDTVDSTKYFTDDLDFLSCRTENELRRSSRYNY